LDPCLEEELKGEGKIVLSYMPHFDQVTHIVQAGKIHHEQLQEAVDLCTDACVGVISKMMRASLASIC
jgi:ribonuclease PH